MKRIVSLVLAVVLMTAVLAPVATANAAGWKWNAAKTQRTLPDSAPVPLEIPYSRGAAFCEREVTLIQPC